MEQESGKSGPRRLVSGGAWFLGLMTLSGFFWLLLGIQMSRVYGPEGYGVFSTTASVFDFMWAFIFGGIFEGLIHFGASYLTKKDADIPSFFSKYLRYLTIMSIIVFVGLSAVAFQTTSNTTRILLFSLACAFLFSGTKDALAAILGSLHKNRQLSTVNSIGFYVITVIGLAFMVMKMPYDLLPLLITFGPISQAVLCVYFSKPYIKDLVKNNIDFFRTRKLKHALMEDFRDYKHILLFGFSVSIGKISFMVMKSLDIPILTLFFDYSNVGIYSVADTASSVLFSMTAFALPIISSISEAWTKNDCEEIENCVKIAVKFPLILGLPLTVIIFVLAEPIILGIFGPIYQGAVMPLQILINGTFLLMFGHTLSSILIGIGKPKLSGTLMGISAVQYIISLFILVPIFGLNGAAISLTLTGVTSLALIPIAIKRNVKVAVFSGIHKVIFSGAVLGVLLFVVQWFYKSNFLIILLGTAASVCVYALLLHFTGYITREEIKMLRNVKPEQ
ncbi:MAG: polysaccharide biosynthesis C-terminal domain-containing protein [Candidatus Bathyarchaeia archaeon]|jgi:stage V sporulation protein B